jgi:hypothetical protein
MGKVIATVLVMATVALFSGCASLSKNQCLQADWNEVGYRDGSQGKPRSQFQSHYDACLQYGVHADRQAYYRGRAEGLRSYCTYSSGLAQGKEGRTYRQVCPPEFEAEFLAGFEKGKRIHAYQSKVTALENRCRSIERKIKQKEKKLYASNTSDQKRTELRNDLRILDLEYREASLELKFLRNNQSQE